MDLPILVLGKYAHMVPHCEDELTLKEFNRLSRERKMEKSKNFKERAKRAYRARCRKRAEQVAKQIEKEKQKVNPHGEEGNESEFCFLGEEIVTDDDQTDTDELEVPPVIASSNVDEARIAKRNKLARASLSSEPYDKNEFSNLLESVSSAGKIEGFEDNDQIDEWLGHLENMVILGYQISRSTSLIDVIVAVSAYAKMYSKKRSVTFELFRIINEMSNTFDEEDAKANEPHSMENWNGRAFLNGWEMFKTNTIFKKISYLITAAMSLTVCTTKKIEWSPFGLQLISLEAAKEQLLAVDVIDAVIKTFVWVAEVGWRCFETRSLAPLLYSDASIQKYNEVCDEVLAMADSAIAGNVPDIGEFENKVKEVLRKTCEMKAQKTDGVTQLWLQKRYSELVGISEKLLAKRKNTALRFSPIGFSLTGGTSVGKSTLGKLTMQQSLAAMDFLSDEGVVDESRILTKDMFDEYDSTWTSDVTGVFLDDLGNTKSEFQKSNPHTSIIIKFFNNVAAQAVKAELNSKGVVFIDFKCGVVTANVQDLCAPQFSNCPESILRRFIHVDVKVKEEYRKDGGTMLNKKHPDIICATSLVQDVWDLTVTEVNVWETAPGVMDWNFVPLKIRDDKNRQLKTVNIGLQEYLDVVVQLSKDHKREQDSVLEKNKNSAAVSFCKECKRHPQFCECDEGSIATCDDATVYEALPQELDKDFKKHLEMARREQEREERMREQEDDQPRGRMQRFRRHQRRRRGANVPHGVEMIADIALTAGKRAVEKYIRSWTQPVDLINWFCGFSPVRQMGTQMLAKTLEKEINDVGTPLLVAITPRWLFRTRVFQNSVYAFQSAAAMYKIKWPFRIGMMCGLGISSYGVVKRQYAVTGLGFVCMWSTSVGSYYMHKLRMKELKARYLETRNALPIYAKKLRDGIIPQGVLLGATIILGVKLIRMWNANRIRNLPQSGDGYLDTSLHVDAIEQQPGWFGQMMSQMKWFTETKVEGAIPEHIMNTGLKNLGYCTFTRADGTQTGCNIVYPEKGYVWFPKHVFYTKADMTSEMNPWVKGDVRRIADKKGGYGRFKFLAEYGANCVSIDGIDMVECFVERCPDVPNKLRKFLPLVRPSGTSYCSFLVRDKEAKEHHEKLAVKHDDVAHRYMEMYGGRYTSSYAQEGGCMGMLITRGSNPVVAGFHIGGNTEKKVGIMMTVTQDQADQLRKKLHETNGCRGMAHSPGLPKEQYGIPMLDSKDIHPHAIYINSMTDKHGIDILGSTKLRRAAKSRVVRSMLCDKTEEVFGTKSCWGPPKMEPNWKPFNATLEHIANPSDMIMPSLVSRAKKDWLKPILKFAKELNAKESICPLTLKEVIMGIPGRRFVDPLVMKTSLGAPLNKKKSTMYTDILEDNVLIDRIPDPALVTEYERCVACWKRGERAYPIASACLKDEPTKIDKDKVRVFHIVANALSWSIRKYFIPIARVLSLCPLLSESAVGINAFGKQWQDLMDYAEKYAHIPPDEIEDMDPKLIELIERIIAWDYSKYDVRMNSQMTYWAWQCMIDIAEVCDYTEDDIKMMSVLLVDVIHPLMDYNGTMLMSYNMNTSGNNITVNINSIVNSLYVRCGLFDACPEVVDFRSVVACTTYGDDFKGSVLYKYRDRFNFRVFQAFLARYSIKITSPSKDDSVFDDLPIDNADFLKRISNFIPEIGRSIGKLSKESMLKPLMANVKSAEAKEVVAISCVDTYMHELFAHGREEYETDRVRIQEICNSVLGMVPESVELTFEQRVEHWLSKYESKLDTKRC